MKMTLLVLLSGVGGMLTGMMPYKWEQPWWVTELTLGSLVLALSLLSWLWVARPYQGLMQRLYQISHSAEHTLLRKLPVRRHDEIGQIAKAFHRMAVLSIRHRHEATHLRRTLDSRVAKATSAATRRLHQLAMRDPLTDLGNRRFFDEQLEPLVRSVREAETDLLCIMIDVDNFKQVNDTCGHEAGDQVLVFLGSLIRACVRSDDLAVRLGGDEFVVLMPSADIERAMVFSRSVRPMFRQQVRTIQDRGPYADLSIGMASLQQSRCESGKELVRLADARLYDAKRCGKGQIAGLC